MKLSDYEYYKTDLGTLFCGDCLEIMPLIADKIDFAFADPPYGSNKADWDTGFDNSFIPLLESISKGGEITCGDKNIVDCIKPLKKYKGIMHNWNMNGMTRGNLGFMDFIIGVVYGITKNGKNYISFTVKAYESKTGHPTPKPLMMLLKTIQRFTNENDLVLDPFLGSGTTAVACEKLNRRWIGIEISEKYCAIDKARIEAEASQIKLAL